MMTNFYDPHKLQQGKHDSQMDSKRKHYSRKFKNKFLLIQNIYIYSYFKAFQRQGYKKSSYVLQNKI
jgi:hypothetical protein